MLLPRPFNARKSCFVLLLGAVLLSTALLHSKEIAPNSTKKTETLHPDDKFDLIDAFLDMNIGVISEDEFKDKLEKNKVKSFKDEFNKKLELLKCNRLGIREVSGESFTRLVNSMKTVSSSHQVQLIGVSKDRAYLEFTLFLSSKYRYVAVVSTDLAKIPDSIAAKLR